MNGESSGSEDVAAEWDDGARGLRSGGLRWGLDDAVERAGPPREGERWSRVLEQVRERNRTLHALLSRARARLEGPTLSLTFATEEQAALAALAEPAAWGIVTRSVHAVFGPATNVVLLRGPRH